MSLRTLVNADIGYQLSENLDFSLTEAEYKGWGVRELTDGAGNGQADRIYARTLTLAASANQDIDLNGALLNPIGGPGVFARVKAIAIRAADTNTNNVVVKPAAANGFLGPFGAAAHQISIQPAGRAILLAPNAGWTVVAGTGDLLNVANSGAGTPVTFDIIVIGTSA